MLEKTISTGVVPYRVARIFLDRSIGLISFLAHSTRLVLCRVPV